jgi:hypothetical protein
VLTDRETERLRLAVAVADRVAALDSGDADPDTAGPLDVRDLEIEFLPRARAPGTQRLSKGRDLSVQRAAAERSGAWYVAEADAEPRGFLATTIGRNLWSGVRVRAHVQSGILTHPDAADPALEVGTVATAMLTADGGARLRVELDDTPRARRLGRAVHLADEAGFTSFEPSTHRFASFAASPVYVLHERRSAGTREHLVVAIDHLDIVTAAAFASVVRIERRRPQEHHRA